MPAKRRGNRSLTGNIIAPLAGIAARAVAASMHTPAWRRWGNSGRGEGRASVELAEGRRGVTTANLAAAAATIVSGIGLTNALIGSLQG
ncbi:hypothetical protein BOTBODRAFT_314508 [Botryobasidium botryosum FD-172 SS1]|uniref:Uncharacterized protein n=1 Tax=Botryobasidium botryosum (strain FD-172 SS1) TaxID=930990 RepID=A0A067MYG2_BOTB1|nr:hypothetical protein BOTBODRAFT_314508 [Botryobasidium botryosum FD-172 SS1]